MEKSQSPTQTAFDQAKQKVAAKEQELNQAKQKDTPDKKLDSDVPKKEQELTDAKAEESAKGAEAMNAQNTVNKMDDKSKEELNKAASSLSEKEVSHDPKANQQHQFYPVDEKKDIAWKEFQTEKPQELDKAKDLAQTNTTISQPQEVSNADLGNIKSTITPYANKKTDVASKYGQPPPPKEQTPQKEKETPEPEK